MDDFRKALSPDASGLSGVHYVDYQAGLPLVAVPPDFLLGEVLPQLAMVKTGRLSRLTVATRLVARNGER